MILKLAKTDTAERDRRLAQLLGNDYKVCSSLIVSKKFYTDNNNHDYYWDSSEHNWILRVPGLTRWSFNKELKDMDDETMIEIVYVYDTTEARTEEDAYFVKDAEELLAGLPAIST